jgi:hypothetical protein
MSAIFDDLDDENAIVAAIHLAICEFDLDDCMYGDGPCVKAANAVGAALDSWSISEHTSNGEDVALLHTCSDEAAGDTVMTVNEHDLSTLLREIAVHDCEEVR